MHGVCDPVCKCPLPGPREVPPSKAAAWGGEAKHSPRLQTLLVLQDSLHTLGQKWLTNESVLPWNLIFCMECVGDVCPAVGWVVLLFLVEPFVL